ncbi:MAG: zinc-dependent metalloprotease [Planctomycetes bacterium]|nr:zinc-dependent metalloprotease [Planctomycetota bacterium]
MFTTTDTGGGFFTGFPLDEHVVQWEILDKQLLLIEPETHYVVDDKNTVSDVVRRTYPDRILTALPIVTKSPGGDPVIDLGRMLKSNFANIGWMGAGGPFGGFGGGGGGINASLSKWTKKKAFPKNVEIGVALAMGRRSPPGSYDKKMVHFSFWALPNSDYKPRVADDRIGYFLTANRDWAKPTEARDIFNRYVDRWHLVKRDPKLKLCQPREPIVFYVEKTVPVKFRRAVRDGILEWNKAFEKIGFVNAVQVRQQTADNEWKDLDPEDMRYSFFRWIVTGGGFAMGPHRANPFTGQIYDADIIFDDSMVRFYEKSAERMLPSTAMALKMRDPVLRDFFEKFPQWKRPAPWKSFTVGEEREEESLRDAMRTRMSQRGHVGCDYMEGMKHQLAVSRSFLASQPPEVIDRFLYDVVKEVVMHEVGHTLGLRHNFKASSIYSMEEVKRRRITGEPTVGSVMDYNPTLFFAKNAIEGYFLTPTLGPYDYWAIEYGYRPADGTYKPKQAADEKEDSDKNGEAGDDAASADKGENPMSNIAEELLAQLPEEARKLIADKVGQMAEDGGKPKKKASPPPSKGTGGGEAEMLRAIASRAGEPELAYTTDEDTTILGPDPRSNRFDMGADPIEWAQERIDLVNDRLSNMLEWAVKDQESWYHVRQVFLSLVFEKSRVLDHVGRYIGGQYTSRAHRGDTDAKPPFEVVSPKLQRQALAFIEKNLFQDEFFEFSPEVLNHLAVARWWHQGAVIDYRVDFPTHSLIGTLQWWNLFNRLFPNTLRRIHDAEMKTSSSERFTVAEYLQSLQRGCWGTTLDAKRAEKGNWTDATPFVSDVRRSLQREYLGLMEPLVRTSPGLLVSPDLHAMLQYSLATTLGQIESVSSKAGTKLDFASAAHLSACKSRIERMLAPQLREYGMFGL